MSQSLHIRNVPDALVERLKHSAERHRRSLNSEVIVTLESGSVANDSESQLALLDRINRLRESNPPSDPEETKRMIREDRER